MGTQVNVAHLAATPMGMNVTFRSEVIAVGPGRVEKGERVKMELAVGDKVIYGKYSGTPYTVDGDEVIIIKASDILAKMG